MKPRFRNPEQDLSPPGYPDAEVVEVPLLLPGWQVTALETAAHDCGLTAAEMVRSLLRDFIAQLPMNQAAPLMVGTSNGKRY